MQTYNGYDPARFTMKNKVNENIASMHTSHIRGVNVPAKIFRTISSGTAFNEAIHIKTKRSIHHLIEIAPIAKFFDHPSNTSLKDFGYILKLISSPPKNSSKLILSFA